MIEIYAKPQCPFCDRAKALCEQIGEEYTYKSLGTDFDRDEMLETFFQCKNISTNYIKW